MHLRLSNMSSNIERAIEYNTLITECNNPVNNLEYGVITY